jgi:hypothetical protein
LGSDSKFARPSSGPSGAAQQYWNLTPKTLISIERCAVPENLVFAGTPLIEQPLGLVFGDSDTSTHPDSLLEVSGALPELVTRLHLVIGVPVAWQAVLPDLVGTVAVKYQSQTQRPTVAQVQTWSQVSLVTESGLTQPQQHAMATNAGATDQAHNAASSCVRSWKPGVTRAGRPGRPPSKS